MTEAAAALDIPEIAVFRRAWWHWYGDIPDEAAIERPFLVYMFGGPAPAWVRDYARRVVVAHRRAPLEPAAWGVRCATARAPLRGLAYAVIVGAAVVFLVVSAHHAAVRLGVSRDCFTPPCYGDTSQSLTTRR